MRTRGKAEEKQEIQSIVDVRKAGGLKTFLVLIKGTEKTKWVNEADVPARLIKTFERQKKSRKKVQKVQKSKEKAGKRPKQVSKKKREQWKQSQSSSQSASSSSSSKRSEKEEAQRSVSEQQHKEQSQREEQEAKDPIEPDKSEVRVLQEEISQQREAEKVSKKGRTNEEGRSQSEQDKISIPSIPEEVAELVADFSEDSEQQGEESVSNLRNRGKNKSKNKKIKKKSKNQSPSGRGKQKIVQSLSRKAAKQRLGLEDENVLDKKKRSLEKKNYNQKVNIELERTQQALKDKFKKMEKDFKRVERIQGALISTVLSTGFSGPYRFYQVLLRNEEIVFIREKDMYRYFPRKLYEFYQRILNKAGKSTEQLKALY